MAKISRKKINHQLMEEIEDALENLGGWGSLEIFVQGYQVTQITKRSIKKTNHDLKSRGKT